MSKKKIGVMVILGAIFSFLVVPNAFAASPASKVNIDLPSNNSEVVDSFYMAGWALSEVNNNVRVNVDGTLVEGVNRFARSDVLDAVKGYGNSSTNPTPGFDGTIDLSSYDYGKHTITVELLDESNSVLTSEKVTVNKKAPASKVNIDMPSNNSEVVDSFYIAGWALSETNNTVRVSVDGTPVEGINRFARSDVLSVVKGYGNSSTNPTPGFDGTIDLSSYDYGKHTITVELLDSKGSVLTSEKVTVNIKKPNGKINIDLPTSGSTVSYNTYISGWTMSEDKNDSIRVSIDGNDVTASISRFYREDVINAINGYGGKSSNPTPGYGGTIDLSTYTDGTHEITVEIISSRGTVIEKTSRKFNLKKYNSSIEFISPSTNETVKTNLSVSGKVTTNAPSKTLKGYIDDVEVPISSDGTNFSFTYDTSILTDGKHRIKIAVILDSGEVIYTKEQQFNVKKYEGTITLDYPQATNIANGSQIYITGWEMSEDINSQVQVYLDNKLQNIEVSRYYREDVINAINGYGGAATNPTPGYSAYLKLTNQSDGYHTLTIKTINSLGEVITTYDKQIYLYSGFSLGVDVSQYNGNINWSSVKNAGGVDFAFIRLGYRGWGAPGNFALDSKFVENVNNAYNAGVKTGVYLFSQAINYQEGVAEADYIINNINMNPGMKDKLSLPIVLDVEDSTAGNGQGRTDNISNEARTDAVRGFIDRMNQYGYKPLIYANLDYLTNKLDLSKWSNYDVWLAHWTYDFNKKSDYNGAYTFWQYHNCGSVSGINGCVDLDLSYE